MVTHPYITMIVALKPNHYHQLAQNLKGNNKRECERLLYRKSKNWVVKKKQAAI